MHSLLLPLWLQAAVCGTYFGRSKWPGTRKSLEGTAAGFLSVLVTIWVIHRSAHALGLDTHIIRVKSFEVMLVLLVCVVYVVECACLWDKQTCFEVSIPFALCVSCFTSITDFCMQLIFTCLCPCAGHPIQRGRSSSVPAGDLYHTGGQPDPPTVLLLGAGAALSSSGVTRHAHTHNFRCLRSFSLHTLVL